MCLCHAQWPFKNTRQYTIPTFTNGRYKNYGYNQPRPSFQQSPTRVSSVSYYRGTPNRNYFQRPVSSGSGYSNTWLRKPSTTQWFTSPSASSSSVVRPPTSYKGSPFVSQGTAVPKMPVKIRPKMPQLVEETQYTQAPTTTTTTTTTESTTITTTETATTSTQPTQQTETTTTTTTETTKTSTEPAQPTEITASIEKAKPFQFEPKVIKKPTNLFKKEDNKEYERFQNWIKANNALSASRPIHDPTSSETLVITTQAPSRKVIPTISPSPTTDTPSVKANQTSEDVLTVSDVKPQASSKTFTPPISTATESVTSRTVKRIRTELANRNITALRPVNQRIRFRPRTSPTVHKVPVNSGTSHNRYKSVYFTRNVNRNRLHLRPTSPPVNRVSLSTTTEVTSTTTISEVESTTKVPFWKKFKLGKRPALHIAEKTQTSESTTPASLSSSPHQIKQFTNVLVTRPTYVVVSTTSASSTTERTTTVSSFLPTLRTSTTTTTTSTTTTATTTTTTTTTPFSTSTTSTMSTAKAPTAHESLEALTNIAEVKIGSPETTTHRIPAKVFKPYPAINKPSYQHTPEKTVVKSANPSGITIIEAAKVVEITTAKPHQPKSFDVMDDFFDRYYRDGWKDEDFKMAENVPDFLRHAVPMQSLLPPVSLRRMDSFATM